MEMVKKTISRRQTWVICSSYYLITYLIAILLLHEAVKANPVNECVDFVNGNGANVQDCSGRDIAVLPKLSEEAEILDFSRNKFTQLPNITESKTCLGLTSCPANNSMVHCRQEISFSRNQIYSLSLGTLNVTCLRTLDLSFNKITDDALSELTFFIGPFHLHRLLLNNNPLKSLQDEVLPQPFIPELRELDLSHCDLETIGKNSVDDFGDLRILNLSFNKLKEIDGQTFKGLKSLERLDLRGNQLSAIDENTFADLDSLKELLLSDNKIKYFHDGAFYRDSQLQFLDLRHNQLTSIPYTTLDKLTKLDTLDLSQNPIRQVNRGSVVSKVQKLILDNMPELTELSPYSLASFPALVSLSISGNKGLKELGRKIMGNNIFTIKHVYLENNRLSSLNSEALPWTKLETVKLGGNPWYCDDNIQWMLSEPKIPSEITCVEPLLLSGRSIKTLSPDDLLRDYSLQSAIGVIVLCVCLPIFGICAVLVWRRRRYCPCVKVTLKGQYVTLFTRDIDDESEQRVAIELKLNANRINAVSNGGADDTKPFIRVKKVCDKIDEEPEDDI